MPNVISRPRTTAVMAAVAGSALAALLLPQAHMSPSAGDQRVGAISVDPSCSRATEGNPNPRCPRG
jgi:hypothetical protein